jgi:HEAT repeat protein
MLLKNVFLISIAVVAIFSFPISNTEQKLIQDKSPDNTKVKQITEAIEGLWSAKDEERQTAKTVLIQLGEAATPSLITLLRDLIRNGAPRYSRTKGDDSTQVVKPLDRFTDQKNLDAGFEAARNQANLPINFRLKEDICEILGSTKSESAIPTLIEMMWKEDRESAWESFNPAMEALAKIGIPSVPELINAIEAPEAIVNRKFGDDPIFTPEVKKRIIKEDTDELRVRSAMVLGEIGDERALPVLETLLKATSEEYLAVHIRKAIEKLKIPNKQ